MRRVGATRGRRVRRRPHTPLAAVPRRPHGPGPALPPLSAVTPYKYIFRGGSVATGFYKSVFLVVKGIY